MNREPDSAFGGAGSNPKLSAKQKNTSYGAFFVLVETTGIEPVTPCMSSKYSNRLSYASMFTA